MYTLSWIRCLISGFTFLLIQNYTDLLFPNYICLTPISKSFSLIQIPNIFFIICQWGWHSKPNVCSKVNEKNITSSTRPLGQIINIHTSASAAKKKIQSLTRHNKQIVLSLPLNCMMCYSLFRHKAKTVPFSFAINHPYFFMQMTDNIY